MQDASASWAEVLVLHEYNEWYLYYSFLQGEVDPRIRKIWELHLGMEIEHLRLACDLFRSIEKKDPESVLPRELPEVVQFKSNKEYVRKVLETQVDLPAQAHRDVKDHRQGGTIESGSPLRRRHRTHRCRTAGSGNVSSREIT